MKIFNHVSGQYFAIDDARIYYETVGDKSKPAVLLLHGGFGTIEDCNPIAGLLTNDFFLVGVDSRGQGKSTLGKEKLSYERMQHDIEALLKSLSIDKISVIGFSDGGIVGCRLAASGSLHIEKLVTIGATWSKNDISLTKELFLRVTADSWKEKFPDTYTRYQQLNPEADFDTLVVALKSMWLDTTASGHPDETARRINCQTLIVRGDNDHLVSRKSVAELAGCIKNATLLNIPFAGHVVYEDQLEIFSSVLKRFMADTITSNPGLK